MLHLVYKTYISHTNLAYLGLSLKPGYYQLNLVVGVAGEINRLDYHNSYPLECFLDGLRQCYLHTDVVNTITGYTQMSEEYKLLEASVEASVSKVGRPFSHSVVDLVSLSPTGA